MRMPFILRSHRSLRPRLALLNLFFHLLVLFLNVRLLTVSVHNPNPASFAYDAGGRTDLTVQAARLVADVESGAVAMEASTRIPGRVSILGGLIKRHAVAYSDCSFVFGVPDMKVRTKQCHDRTKL